MRRILGVIAIFAIPMLLAACGGGANADEEQAKINEAVAFITTAQGSPGLFVSGRDIVVNYAERPMTYADDVRRVALEATKAINGKQVKVYVVDSADVATAVPASGQFHCTITANDGRMAGNNC